MEESIDLFNHFFKNERASFISLTSESQDKLVEQSEELVGLDEADVLDFGTGTGELAWKLASEGGNVTGVDLSPEAIGYARDIEENVGGETEFLVRDAVGVVPGVENFEPEDSFDLITAINSTHYHPRETLSALNNYLNSNGVLVSTVPPERGKNMFDPEAWKEVEQGITQITTPVYLPHPGGSISYTQNVISEDKYEDLLEDSGFTDIEVYDIELDPSGIQYILEITDDDYLAIEDTPSKNPTAKQYIARNEVF